MPLQRVESYAQPDGLRQAFSWRVVSGFSCRHKLSGFRSDTFGSFPNFFMTTGMP